MGRCYIHSVYDQAQGSSQVLVSHTRKLEFLPRPSSFLGCKIKKEQGNPQSPLSCISSCAAALHDLVTSVHATYLLIVTWHSSK